jgi:hypothetical protein
VRRGSAAEWSAWINRGRYLWAGIGLLLVGGFAWQLAPHTQATLRRIWFFYEAVGALLVLIELARVMQDNGVPGPLARLLRFTRDCPALKPAEPLRGVPVTTFGGSGSLSYGKRYVRPPPDATLEQRLEHVTAEVQYLLGKTASLDQRIDEAAAAARKEVAGGAARTGGSYQRPARVHREARSRQARPDPVRSCVPAPRNGLDHPDGRSMQAACVRDVNDRSSYPLETRRGHLPYSRRILALVHHQPAL